ncbi:galactitol-1-phosphate 5-dehydrogenase [bacterium]|nr:galactitol-1-phosphate 5-dehydrogenase [bacterium]
MKALLLEAYSSLVLRELPGPTPGPGEILVRVRACGICGSDVHGLDGSTGRRVPPLVMGHEAAGEVAVLGQGVSGPAVGARVTFDSTIYCGECRFCQAGKVNLCDSRQVIGVSCDEYRRDGAFAEYVCVPARCVYELPAGLTFEQAAVVEPLSVAVHAVERVPLEMDGTALVAGAGMIGLLLVQLLKLRGFRRVLVSDPDPSRLALARELGADEVLDPGAGPVMERIERLTAGRGVDAAFDAVGLEASLGACVGSLRKGGALCLIGNISPKVSLPLQRVVARELTLYGSCASAGEYPLCLDLLAGGAVRVEPLISAAAPLDEGALWFERLRAGGRGLIKVILQP